MRSKRKKKTKQTKPVKTQLFDFICCPQRRGWGSQMSKMGTRKRMLRTTVQAHVPPWWLPNSRHTLPREAEAPRNRNRPTVNRILLPSSSSESISVPVVLKETYKELRRPWRGQVQRRPQGDRELPRKKVFTWFWEGPARCSTACLGGQARWTFGLTKESNSYRPLWKSSLTQDSIRIQM